MIISCSRRTDIPAFYSNWLINRLREGLVLVRNPMNAKQVRRVSLLPADVDCFVFWTKDAGPMLDKLPRLRGYPYYFQFTLTPYDPAIEPHLPPKSQIIDTFRRLSDNIGAKRVIWRYDPILFTKDMGIDEHLEHFEKMARRLTGHTHQCIISFLDVYRHLQSRLTGLAVRPPDESEMRTLAASMARLAASCGMSLETCAEKIDLSDLNIGHGRCIDDRLIFTLTGKRPNFSKDRYQRKLCGCIASVDIGEYNTCGHLCQYCYANVSRKKIEKSRLMHDEHLPLLTGQTNDK